MSLAQSSRRRASTTPQLQRQHGSDWGWFLLIAAAVLLLIEQLYARQAGDGMLANPLPNLLPAFSISDLPAAGVSSGSFIASAQRHWELAYAPGAVLFIFMLAAVVVCWWSWRRYGPEPHRGLGKIAKSCRCAAWLILIALLTGPQQREVTDQTLRGTLAVYHDPSASMTIADGLPADDGDHQGRRQDIIAPLQQRLSTWADEHDARLIQRAITGYGSVTPSDATLAPTDGSQPTTTMRAVQRVCLLP